MNDGGEFTARQSIKADLGFLTRFDFGLKAFSQTEVEQHRIDVFHVDHVSAIFQIVAHVDLTQACHAIKRSEDFQTLKRGLSQGQFGLGHLQCGFAFVQGTLADEILRHQLFVARVIGLCNGQLGLGLHHLCCRQLVIKLHQDLALFDTLTIFEQNLADASTHFRAQNNALVRTQTAHRLSLVHNFGLLDFGNFHGCGFCGSTRCTATGNIGRCRIGSDCGCFSGRGVRFILQPPGSTRSGCDADQSNREIWFFERHQSFRTRPKTVLKCNSCWGVLASEKTSSAPWPNCPLLWLYNKANA